MAVTAPQPLPLQGIADGHVTLIGKAAPISNEEERAAAKEVYMSKHPSSVWVGGAGTRLLSGLG